MPFARVGPYAGGGPGVDGGGNRPRSSSSSGKNTHNNGDGGGRSKGITMEDLKKQTALRLAKKHRASGGGGRGRSNSTGGRHRMESPHQMYSSKNIPAPRPHPTGPIPQSNHIGHQSPYVYSQDQQQQQQQPGGYYNPPHIGGAPPYNGGGPVGGMYGSGHGGGGYPAPPHPELQHGAGGSSSQMTTGHSSQFDQQQQHNPSYQQRYSPPLQYQGQYPANHPSYQTQPPSSGHVLVPSQLTVATASGLQPLGSAQSNMADSSNIKGGGRSGNSGKNKLPHGLTVHELKEMTKARLQAEAGDKPENGPDSIAAASSSSTSSTIDRSLVGTSPHPPVTTNTNSGVIVGRHTQPSPLPGVGAPSFRPVTHRSDTWDSASVASYNSTAGFSDNFGSAESVVSDVGSHAGNRNRSFTYPAVQVPESENFGANLNLSRESYSNPPSAQASPSKAGLGGYSQGQYSFDAAVGGNRRRAVTLSPNAGSILEDRPHHYGSTIGTDNLIIPSFSSNASGERTAVQTHQQRGYSPVLGQLGLSVLGSVGGDILDDGFRRSTGTDIAGAPSLSRVEATTPERHSLNDLPTTRASGAAQRDHPSVAVGPPGFASSGSLFHSGTSRTAFSKVGSVESIPESFQAEKTGYWNSSIEVSRPHFSSVDNLANDMGSLLNLSGASTPDRPDRGRANTYTFGAASNPGPSGSFFASLPEDDFVGGRSSHNKKDPFRHP
eukprot:CAMPEP_0113468232 /NCGR_PEP_ID=MMETSP0014_2-20120614/15243_1 /TAXON_ID=2857 /ORGANISM="Nitzschia sp." /LENGTH=718 /DNA_ID=CAMNT_0000360603 /DNA_START=46 /DNA_END=2202 /DNA_ORIENTATION=- /assembly_acc=CAM_ASM_000159